MGTRRVTVKRGALYTADPLLPDTTGSACRLPGLHGSASNVPGGCKKVSRPLRAPEGCSAKNATTGEMHWSCGVHCASFFVIHLHDRHGAHLTLPIDSKQASQSLGKPHRAGLAEVFSYALGKRRFGPSRPAFFVSISLQPVTQTFQVGNFRRLTAN